MSFHITRSVRASQLNASATFAPRVASGARGWGARARGADDGRCGAVVADARDGGFGARDAREAAPNDAGAGRARGDSGVRVRGARVRRGVFRAR